MLAALPLIVWSQKFFTCGVMIDLNVRLIQDGKEEVLQAWYMDDSEEDQRLPHHREPKEFVSLEKLKGSFLCTSLMF